MRLPPLTLALFLISNPAYTQISIDSAPYQLKYAPAFKIDTSWDQSHSICLIGTTNSRSSERITISKLKDDYTEDQFEELLANRNTIQTGVIYYEIVKRGYSNNYLFQDSRKDFSVFPLRYCSYVRILYSKKFKQRNAVFEISYTITCPQSYSEIQCSERYNEAQRNIKDILDIFNSFQ
jgi:hypothetical protein